MLLGIKKTIKRMLCKARFGRKVILGKGCNISLHSFFEGNNKVSENASFSGSMGYGSYIGGNSHINAKIGRYCSIAYNVMVVSGNHPSSGFVSTHPAFFSIAKQSGFTYVSQNLFDEHHYADAEKHQVVIGNDVWIGANALILAGVHIGDGAIIGAGAVVTKDVAPYTIVGGAPAKVIRKRFTDSQIAFLEEFKWWNKDKEWIAKNSNTFCDIDVFMREFDK